jgi:catechol 2,3-dioxygenase-like lactoylglutathione lyase family enzyme
MFKGLEHTALASPDPEKLAKWYVDHLEFRVNHRYGGNVFVRAADGSMLEIIPGEGPRENQNLKTPGIRHLAVTVEDFDAAYENLKGKGVNFVTDLLNMGGNRLVFFTDLDGNYIHLLKRPAPLP